MENQLFLNKYQPRTLNEFESDDEMIDILNNLINMNKLNILFIGDIGSGKTTYLNAVIKEYYKQQNYSDNILYINSLKEQGISYYRTEVKTFCQTSSSIKYKKKMVILDDIDIINEQSQQVFRNYIDKYSHNVHFISTCCNSQKVIESLQSRFIIIKIKPLKKEQLHNIVSKIISSENISIDNDAVDFVLNVCSNNAKILINYMEKFKLLNEHINVDLASNLCTNINFLLFVEYTQYIIQHNLEEAIKLLYDIYDKGYSVMDILDNYFLFIKTTNMLNETQKYNIVPIICKYIAVFHNIHEDEIELALFTNNVISLI
jgi:DNA polymerase III delta prime subunit